MHNLPKAGAPRAGCAFWGCGCTGYRPATAEAVAALDAAIRRHPAKGGREAQ
jgi:hypothetical protein